jgi:pimeloyl-ACP methyl ester carboxylesterase
VKLRALRTAPPPERRLEPRALPFGFEGQGSETGVLLLHDLGATPASLRPWAEGLTARGWTVLCPRLPGHGTGRRDLAATRVADWVDEARMALVGMAERCRVVVVGGVGLGALIALDLAARDPGRVAGVVAVDPQGAGPRSAAGPGDTRPPLRARIRVRAYRRSLGPRLALVRAPVLVATPAGRRSARLASRLPATADLVSLGRGPDHLRGGGLAEASAAFVARREAEIERADRAQGGAMGLDPTTPGREAER